VLIDPSLPNPGSIDAIVDEVEASIFGRFDLTKAGIGQYDVVVTNPDGQSAILLKGFTVLDTNPPETEAIPRGATYNTPLSVTLLTNEPATIYYYDSVESEWVEYSEPINISFNTTLEFYAIDAAGNTEDTKTETYTIDTRFQGIAVLDSPTPELIIPVTSTFTFPPGTRAIVVDCHKVNHTLRDSEGNVLLPTDYLKHYVIGPPDTPGSDVKTYSGDVSVTCDLAKLYPPESLQPGDYTLEVNYSNFFQPPGIQLFQGSISAVSIPVHVAEAITTHIITTEAGAGGSIFLSGSVVSGPVVVKDGSSPTFTITPDTGYHIMDVKVDGDSKGPIHTYTFQNVTGDHMIEATFGINTYIILSAAGFHGTISPFGIVKVKYGENMTFTITPDTGYHVDKLIVDLKSVPPSSSYTFNKVTNYHLIFATFEIDSYLLTVTKAGAGSGSVTVSPGTLSWKSNIGTATYPYNTTVTLTASPGRGSTFAGWSVVECNCTTTIKGPKLTINKMCGPCNVKATFNKKP
jgi:hypothetical protein